ncbi:MAG: hypothetical protein WC763_01695 [Candidatus Paceibacterota bacterium]|jgi:hypothetical protein
MNVHSKIHHIVNSIKPHSRGARVFASVGLALICALLIFQAGVAVGYRKASFSRELGNNFYRMFDGGFGSQGRGGMMPPPGFMFAENLPGGHGATGRIASLNLPSFIVVGPDGIERVVVVSDDTDIRRFRETLEPADLVVGDQVVVLGSPDEAGQISARLIRIMPPQQN